MKQKHTPDRIWAWYFLPEKQDDVMVGGWDDKPDRKEAEYMLATPVRKSASELLEALDQIQMAETTTANATVRKMATIARAAIAKATGETK